MDETYEENEKVLVHHQNRIYEAKIIKIESKKNDKKKLQYYIHYLGWKEKWNEWIESNKILKLTEKNKEYQKKVNNKAAAVINSISKKSNNSSNKKIKQEIIKYNNNNNNNNDSEYSDDGGNNNDDDDENSNNGGEDADDANEDAGEDNVEDAGEDAENSEQGSPNEDASPRSTTSSSSNTSSSSSSKNNKRKRNEQPSKQIKYIDIEIPISLKNKLVDDWNFINNEKSILSLPKSPNVKDIFSKIVEENEKQSSSLSSLEYKEIINGIIQYFNKALGSLLLYKFERPQYDTILKHNQNKSMSDIYGAEHLLRLFVKLPQLLVVSNLEEKTIIQIKEVLNKVVEYLEKNLTTLFSKEYSVAPSPYLKAASSN